MGSSHSRRLDGSVLADARPLDLVLFKGGDAVSGAIRMLQQHYNPQAGHYSHVGVIVTTDVLKHPRMKPGRRYILESTATGFLGCGVKNIDKKGEFCVQLTDFDKLARAYLKTQGTEIAVAHLREPKQAADVAANLQAFWEANRGRSYQFNIPVLLSAIFPRLRGYRKQLEKLIGGGDWVFCSQLACQVYQCVGVIPTTVDSKNVVPEDLVGCDTDVGLNHVPSNLFEEPRRL